MFLLCLYNDGRAVPTTWNIVLDSSKESAGKAIEVLHLYYLCLNISLVPCTIIDKTSLVTTRYIGRYKTFQVVKVQNSKTDVRKQHCCLFHILSSP